MKLVKVGKYILRDISGEFILLPIDSNVSNIKKIYKMNETGVLIWENIKTEISKDELINIVINSYSNGDRKCIRKDVSEYIDKLLLEEIIVAKY